MGHPVPLYQNIGGGFSGEGPPLSKPLCPASEMHNLGFINVPGWVTRRLEARHFGLRALDHRRHIGSIHDQVTLVQHVVHFGDAVLVRHQKAIVDFVKKYRVCVVFFETITDSRQHVLILAGIGLTTKSTARSKTAEFYLSKVGMSHHLFALLGIVRPCTGGHDESTLDFQQTYLNAGAIVELCAKRAELPLIANALVGSFRLTRELVLR